jgi:hypothetical protein
MNSGQPLRLADTLRPSQTQGLKYATDMLYETSRNVIQVSPLQMFRDTRRKVAPEPVNPADAVQPFMVSTMQLPLTEAVRLTSSQESSSKSAWSSPGGGNGTGPNISTSPSSQGKGPAAPEDDPVRENVMTLQSMTLGSLGAAQQGLVRRKTSSLDAKGELL